MRQVTFRPALVDDAGHISDLMTGLAADFITPEFSDEGRDHLLAQFTVPRMAARLSSDDYRFHVAEDGAVLAGVVAIRGNTHLCYLFTARAYQRAGLARRLWVLARDEAVRAGNTNGRFTVNASRFAVLAYERLGFRRAGERQEVDGVRFQPMEWTA